MNTDQIARVIGSDPLASDVVRGIYPRDDFILSIPNATNAAVAAVAATELFICNLDDCDKPGSHWIVIERHRGDIFYFDSYGLPPVHDDLAAKLVEMTRSTITWNNTQLQELDTNVCGQYCILYCLLRARQHSPEDIVNTLHHNDNLSTHQRDHVIATAINQRFGTQLPNLTSNIHDIDPFIKP
jgi:hypothetical protein